MLTCHLYITAAVVYMDTTIASTVIFCGSSFSRNTRMHTTLERVMCALALCPITTSSSQQLARTVLHAAGTMHCGLHNGIHGWGGGTWDSCNDCTISFQNMYRNTTQGRNKSKQSVLVWLSLTKEGGEQVIPGRREGGQVRPHSMTCPQCKHPNYNICSPADSTPSPPNTHTDTLTLLCRSTPPSQEVPWTQPASGGPGTWAGEDSRGIC